MTDTYVIGGVGLAIDTRSWESIGVESEARALCDRHGITDFDEYQRMCAYVRHRRFMEAIEPYQKMRVRIFAMQMLDRIVLNSDGSSETFYKPFPPEVEACLGQIDDLIAAEAKRWGFAASHAFATQPHDGRVVGL